MVSIYLAPISRCENSPVMYPPLVVIYASFSALHSPMLPFSPYLKVMPTTAVCSIYAFKIDGKLFSHSGAAIIIRSAAANCFARSKTGLEKSFEAARLSL